MDDWRCLQTIKDGKQYLRQCVLRFFLEWVLKACYDDLGLVGNRCNKLRETCPNCQDWKDLNKEPVGFLQCIQVVHPFQKVGIDLLGQFPFSNNGYKIIIVAVDYLKWVELRTMPNGNEDMVATFFVQQIVPDVMGRQSEWFKTRLFTLYWQIF